jgi:DMSO/TMAO reductase YedYZ molybdopterin-dependent catalytic subunit
MNSAFHYSTDASQFMRSPLCIIHGNKNWPKKEWLLNKALRIDDDVAEALYSRNRLVPTYTKSQITPLRNNYNRATPDPGYIPGWRLTLDGLASGLSVSLNIRNLLASFRVQRQITRLVCVEGWSAVPWWAGLRFDDLLLATHLNGKPLTVEQELRSDWLHL